MSKEPVIDWLNPIRKHFSGADVVITIRSTGTAITFHRDSHLKITSEDRIMVGISNNRIYFKDGLGYNGYKLSKEHCLSIKRSLPEFVGTYELQRDGELYFIERNE